MGMALGEEREEERGEEKFCFLVMVRLWIHRLPVSVSGRLLFWVSFVLDGQRLGA